MRLELKIEENPRFKEIIDLSNDLWNEMVSINLKLIQIRIPKFWPWKAGTPLKETQSRMGDMLEKYNAWYSKAVDFSLNPDMTLGGTSELERAVSFLHYMNAISNRINQLEGKFNENEEGYRALASISRDAKTFFWSIVFFCISTAIAITLAVISIINK